jgi:hypothetical protein
VSNLNEQDVEDLQEGLAHLERDKLEALTMFFAMLSHELSIELLGEQESIFIKCLESLPFSDEMKSKILSAMDIVEPFLKFE